jgi:quercetin dioxygenase-like cupin family protein
MQSEEECAVGDLFRPEQAESVSIDGVEVIFRMSGRETDDAYAVLEFRLEPGRLIPPHAHRREHEVSFVLEGAIGVRIEDKEMTAEQGSFVVKRPQVTHAWWNATASPARVLEVISPAGFERYFRELAEIHASCGFREPRLVADLQDRYELSASPEWIPLLKATHGLRLLGE